MLVKRPWGSYEVLLEQQDFLVKRIDVDVEGELSLQSHQHREEVWSCVQGQGMVTVGNTTSVFLPADVIHIPKGEIHRIKNVGAKVLTLTEVQLGSILSEDDITRYEDKYGRVE